MALDPVRVDVGRVDEIESARNEGVEHVERALLVCGPAKDVAAERERCDFDPRSAERLLHHERSPTNFDFDCTCLSAAPRARHRDTRRRTGSND
jgi:hypothetical protein